MPRSPTSLEIEEGTELIGEAEPVKAFSNVMSGIVKLTKSLPDGRQQVVGLQFAPDFIGRPFGEESNLNAEAATSVSLCSFPRNAVERLMKEAPELERRIFKQNLRELDEARQWMVTLGQKTASEKLASFLMLIARNIDPTLPADRSSAAFDLPLTRGDIADFLGLTIETVSRQLTKLSADGVIAVNNRRISVKSLARLARRAGG